VVCEQRRSATRGRVYDTEPPEQEGGEKEWKRRGEHKKRGERRMRYKDRCRENLIERKMDADDGKDE
jgi:hypothetical protein